MKKTLLFRVLAFVMCILSLTSCGQTSQGKETSAPVSDADTTSAHTAATEETEIPVIEPEYYINPLTGEKNLQTNVSSLRPFAVVLKNDKNGGAPQFGIAQADIVYEAAVEGGMTRLLALYADCASVGDIGPVIDSRTYFFDIASGFDAVFVQAGSTKNGNAVLKAKNLDCIDAVLGGAEEVFRRDEAVVSDRGYVNSILATGMNLKDAVSRRSIRRLINEESVNNAQFVESFEDCSTVNGKVCVNAKVSYSVGCEASFAYSTVTGEYTRYQFGEKHTDAEGNALKYKNVIIMFADYKVADSASGEMNADITASGSGYFVSAGRYIPITWSKYSENTPIQYYTENGEKLSMLQGKTFVCVTPSSRKKSVSFE